MIFYFLGILAFIFVLGVVIFPVETDSLRSSIGISKDPSTKFLHGHKIVASKQKYQASLFYSSKPLENYDESIRRVHERISTQEIDAADYGHSIIMTHGHKTEKVIVFYHGYTNCPRQFEDLGKKFFEQGYNVYVPRVPHHGINDLFTKEIGRLTIRELMQVCDESVDIARGLGKKVTVLGISMGGVMAAWNAQFREDLDKAVLVVPSFGWYFLPGIIKPLVNVSFLFPNSFLWWDPVKREKRRSPFSMYHRFSTHGMGHILRLGLSVFRASKKQAPLSKNIYVMTNDMDIAVDEPNIKKVAENWKRFGANVAWYRFSKELKMEHDIVDPLHPYARVDFVYEKILEKIAG